MSNLFKASAAVMAVAVLSFIFPVGTKGESNGENKLIQAPAQSSSAISTVSGQYSDGDKIELSTGDSNIFHHLGVGVSLGTTGIGIDLSTHVTDHFRIRAGVDYTPHISFPMSFSLQSYTDGGVNSGNFEKLQKYMKRLTGTDVDDKIEMNGKPTMTNFKFLVDVYPWVDMGWRFTAGFYVGSRKVAKAVNTMGEMPSLLAVNIYNNFYDYIMSDAAIEEPFYGDNYLDPYLVDELREDLQEQGYMGIHVGDFKDGKPYMMQHDSDGMVKVNAFVNSFKPYLALGYTGTLDKAKRFKIDVDCGMLMWGGSPTLITHDGVDLTTQVKDIKGKPGDYVKLMKSFKVYPVVSVRFAYKIF